jgi:FkbM family methyltransferase
MKIIYDLGANDGNNIPYYLLKADTVIAVEANPTLTAKINVDFSKEIAARRLFVVNAVLVDADADADADADVNFYLHKFGKDKHGQFPQPEPDKIGNYEVIKLPSITIVDLIKKFGQPYYIKIDIEYMDEKILKQLFLANIFPPYISA